MDKKRNDYYFNIFLNLSRAIYMQLEKGWDNEARVSGITYAQQHALWLLHVQDGLTLEEIGNIAIWNKSTTSALISRLAKKGLVYKEKEEGGRTIRIYLTKEGKKKINDSVNTNECLSYMSLLKDLDEEKIKLYLSTLKEIYALVSQDKNQDFARFIDQYSNNLLKNN